MPCELSPALSNPFIVASCHLTANIRSIESLNGLFRRWGNHFDHDAFPGAVILKSISEQGGDGNSGSRQMWTDKEYPFIRYTDGTKDKELLRAEVASKLLIAAKSELPKKTKIGASILLGESNTPKYVKELFSEGADFVELNTKYLSRKYKDESFSAEDKAKNSFSAFKKEINSIIKLGCGPIWIKFARDIIWIRTKDIIEFSREISENKVAFVFANTRQYYISETGRTPNNKAIIWGKNLYPATYDMVVHLRGLIDPNVPIIANGGITTFNQTINVINAGASAIEYCAYFHDGDRGFAKWKDEMRNNHHMTIS